MKKNYLRYAVLLTFLFVTQFVIADDNPNLPTELNFMSNLPLPEGEGSNGSSGDGRYLYVPLFNRDVHVYDMQDINSPLLVSKIEAVVQEGANLGSTFYYNNLLFIADWSKNLHIYDCSDPSNITEESTTVVGGNIASMSFDGNYAHLLLRYVTGLANEKSKFVIMDISNPQNLQIKSEIIVDGTGQNHYYSTARKLVYIRGHLSGVTGALTTLDISNIDLPRILNITNAYFNQLVGFDEYFIVSQRAGNQSTLSVYSTADASNPTVLKSFQLPVNRIADGMAFVNGTLLISTYMPISPYTYTLLTYVYDETSNEFLAGLTLDDTQGWGSEEFVLFKEPIAKTENLNKSNVVNSIADNPTIYYAVYGYGSPPQRVIAMKWPGGTLEPLLTVSGTRRKDRKCPTQVVQGEYYSTGIITITADDIADWSLGGFKLDATGNGNDRLDIASVLIQGPVTVATRYFDDDGVANVTFSPPILIAKGTSQVFTVSYSFAFDPETYGNDTIKVFSWRAKGVTATPLEYEPGLIQGQARMDSLIFARVHVMRDGFEAGFFAKIQDAIDAETTRDGDEIFLCDGEYEQPEIEIDKKLTLQSYNGYEKVTLKNSDVTTPESLKMVISIYRSNITVRGITIFGKSGDNEVRGIYISHRDSAFSDIKIENNQFMQLARGIAVTFTSLNNIDIRSNIFTWTQNAILFKYLDNAPIISIIDNSFNEISSYDENYIDVDIAGPLYFNGNQFNQTISNQDVRINFDGILQLQASQNSFSHSTIFSASGQGDLLGNAEFNCNEFNQNFNSEFILSDFFYNTFDSTKNFSVSFSENAEVIQISNSEIKDIIVTEEFSRFDLSKNLISGNLSIETEKPNEVFIFKIEDNTFDSDGRAEIKISKIKPRQDAKAIFRKNTLLKNYSITFFDCSNIDFKENIIRNAYYHGVQFSVCNNIEVEKNQISKASWIGIYGYRVEDINLRYNMLTENKAGGAQFADCKNMKISQNLRFSGSEKFGLRIVHCQDVMIHDNRIDNNEMEGIYISDSYKNVLVVGNRIRNNHIGILAEKTAPQQPMDLYFAYNNLDNNCSGIKSIDAKFKASNNIITDSWCLFTGINLDNSSADLVGNTIFNNSGNGIYIGANSNANVDFNNFLENNPTGLNNANPNISIDASNNFWGSSEGPQGSDIAGNVTVASWLDAPVTLQVSFENESRNSVLGKIDSVLVQVQNILEPNDLVSVTVSDELGWIVGDYPVSKQFTDSTGYSFYARYTVPDDNTGNDRLFVQASSLLDAQAIAADTMQVCAYQPSLDSISISPDSVSILNTDSTWFSAVCYDQNGKETETDLQWSATLGSIDQNGIFYPDSLLGLSIITVLNSATGISDTAVINLAETEPVLAEITISPETACVKVDETVAFAARGFDQYGYKISTMTVWSASGGSITEYGLFTADTLPGSYSVTASDTTADVSASATVVIEEAIIDAVEPDPVPVVYSLAQNYPNPFNPLTTILYSLPIASHASLKVYDITGREVAVLTDKEQKAGYYRIDFDGSRLASGVYIYRFNAGKYTSVRKFVLLK